MRRHPTPIFESGTTIYSALDGPHQRLKPILKQAFFAAVNAAPPKKRFRWTGHRTLVCRGGNSFRGWWWRGRVWGPSTSRGLHFV